MKSSVLILSLLMSFIVLSTLAAVQAQAQAQPNVPHKTVPNEPPAPKPGASTEESSANEPKGSLVMSQAYFLSPKDGEKVAREITVKLGVRGMKPAKAGEIELGTGHFHVTVDGAPVAKGQMIPLDSKHIHLSNGESELKMKLAPGKRTLTVQFADGTHRSYGEIMSQTITVIVK